MENNGKTLTRAQVAVFLNRDIRSVRNYHGRYLHPVQKSPGGAWLYDRSEVEALAVHLHKNGRKKTGRRAKAKSAGEIARIVFQCLDLGVSFRDIVKLYAIEPIELRRLQREYYADGGRLEPSEDEKIELEKLRLKNDELRLKMRAQEERQTERTRKRLRRAIGIDDE